MKMCGTVSTIWGSPIGGATRLEDAVEFTKRWLEIGADDIEHADHDGSASAAEVYRYFAMTLDAIPDPRVHIAHFHETKRVASASVLAALQAGICHFEATLGGMGGQPANFLDDCSGTRHRRVLLRRSALCRPDLPGRHAGADR
jgi:hydroxymethylglutaryl-CoA lyase